MAARTSHVRRLEPACDTRDSRYTYADSRYTYADSRYTYADSRYTQVEGCLYEHPAVGEVAAVGVPDARLGESVGVAIVLKPNHPGPTPTDAQLRQHVKERLAAFKTALAPGI